MPFQFEPTQIPDVVLIRVRNLPDGRGFFRETFKTSEFQAGNLSTTFVQDNHSHSTRGVLRGLHYQKNPKAQGKLIIAIHGEIFDVAVDIRRGSPTYGKWVGQALSAENGCMLYIPPGFAHGLCVLSEQADVVYKVTAEYAPELDRGILWDDPDLGIDWHIANPSLSPKDSRWPWLRDADNNFEYP